MNKRREDVQYTSAAIMNRPKPKTKVPTAEPTPNNEEKKEEMDVEKDEGGPTIEEMDVD
jgi:heat shock protein 4